jgi:hypothetical protein
MILMVNQEIFRFTVKTKKEQQINEVPEVYAKKVYEMMTNNVPMSKVQKWWNNLEEKAGTEFVLSVTHELCKLIQGGVTV